MNKRLLLTIVFALIVLLGGLFLIFTLLSPPPAPPAAAPFSLGLITSEKTVLPTVTYLIKKGEKESDLCFSLVDRLEKVYRNRAIFRCIDIVKEPELARIYKVKSVPAIIIMNRTGRIIYQHEGYVDEEIILEKLRSAGME